MIARTLDMGKVYRYARPYRPEPEEIDHYANYFHVTETPGDTLALLEAGINPVREVASPEGPRRPAILISSSPHKIGTEGTPWQDFFDTDNGHIRYYGDNKTPGTDPAASAGNKILLDAFGCHDALKPELRSHGVPVLFFRRVGREGKRKGFVQFEGFGIIDRAERVTQYDRSTDRTFTNYAFDFLVMSLAAENEQLDWSWIVARRDASCRLEQTLDLAPAAWKSWIKHGKSSSERYRRRVSKLLVTPTNEQRPRAGSKAEKALNQIFEYYVERGRQRFEALAAAVSARVISGAGERYVAGWITQPSSDWGVDYIGRLDVGSGFASTKLVVLGQAKCEKPDNPTSGNHIARTVARLKRGWLGVYVTTSYFSEQVQREVLEDRQPIVLIHGLRLAEEVLGMVYEGGYLSVTALLNEIDSHYEQLVQQRRPEEILID